MNKKKKKTKTANRPSSSFYLIIGVLCFCIIGFVILKNLPKEEVQFDYKNQPFLGEASAPVSIVEFGDYKCPVCKNFTQSAFPELKETLIDTGKAKFYFMNFPFINVDSTRAAQFAEAVYRQLGDETFWKFHELLYEKQPDDTKYESIDLYTNTFLEDVLKEVTSEDNVKKVMDNLNGDNIKAVDEDLEFVEKLKINSTPTFYVNGVEFTGKTMDDLTKMVEDAAK